MPKQPDPTTTKPKREADAFTEARRLYNKRRNLLREYDECLDDASPRVKSLVDSLEAEDAKSTEVEEDGPVSE